jgi:hypothetical protein
MYHRSLRIPSILLLFPGYLVAQDPPDLAVSGTAAEPPEESVPGEVRAVRFQAAAPEIDGRLDDDAWIDAPALTGLLQKDPVEGAAPSESTEVRFVYDDRALYVGFRAFDREPDRIYGRLVRRDQRATTDGFSLFIDSYYDHRTSYEFTFNPSGARRDVFIYNDGGGRDESWDPVYDWATKTDSLGWVVEMRLPFSQLRFPAGDSVVFGVRVRRTINRRAEDLNWPFFKRDQVGEASQYADLTGLVDIPRPRRIELLPYVAGSARFEPEEVGNPFQTGTASDYRVGGDLKVGVTSGLTLDLTVNPDFGQVEADAAVVNLSEFESFFPEKRPFFVEGTDLFRFGIGPSTRGFGGGGAGGGGGGGGGGGRGQEGLVFTRRIGRAPQVSPLDAGGYGESLNQTTILNASKLSGQVSGGWAFGVLQAVTAQEHARIVDSLGVAGESSVEPLTSYTVVRGQRNVNRGRVVYGTMGTATVRRLNEPRFESLHDRAFSGGADVYFRFGNDRYELSSAIMGSRVEGTAEALLETQTRSARYFQRPDQTHSTLDSSRTGLGGYAGNLRIAKVTGFITWEGRLVTRSPGFETNDLGYLRRADLHEQRAEVELRWLKPGRVFRRFTWQVEQNAQFTYGWERTQAEVQTQVSGDLRNYWNLSLTAQRSFPSDNATLLRGGPAFREPGNWRTSLRWRSDFRRPVWLNANATYETEQHSEADSWSGSAGFRWAPPAPFSLNLNARARWETTDRQYLMTQTPADSSYYVFGRLERQELSTTLRIDLAVTPRLSLELYAEPFVSRGSYQSLKLVDDPKAADYAGRFDQLDQDRLTRPGNGEDIEVDVDRDGEVDFSFEEPDFRVVSLRTNAVLRWEFRPGSTLFLVWQQSRYDRVNDRNLSLTDALTAEGTQNLMIKIAYWLGA